MAPVFMHQAAEYQSRRGDEKVKEAERRKQLLSQAPQDITPSNKGQHVWTAEKNNLDSFESNWSLKPVSVKGIFDHTREMKILKERNGEKGVEIITPFYTHLDTQGKEQAILVNRGWVPFDLKDQRLHYNSQSLGTISGVLYRGDAKTKYWKPNSPALDHYTSVQPYDCSLITQVPNQEEASQFMLHMIDFDEERRQLLPTVPTTSELTQFVIPPERHQAYEMMWRMLAFGGVVANTALWLYF
jgi:cytochrome oxidase assembly protein ShyY1